MALTQIQGLPIHFCRRILWFWLLWPTQHNLLRPSPRVPLLQNQRIAIWLTLTFRSGWHQLFIWVSTSNLWMVSPYRPNFHRGALRLFPHRRATCTEAEWDHEEQARDVCARSGTTLGRGNLCGWCCQTSDKYARIVNHRTLGWLLWKLDEIGIEAYLSIFKLEGCHKMGIQPL